MSGPFEEEPRILTPDDVAVRLRRSAQRTGSILLECHDLGTLKEVLASRLMPVGTMEQLLRLLQDAGVQRWPGMVGTWDSDASAGQNGAYERTGDRDRVDVHGDRAGGVGDAEAAGGAGPDRGEPRRLTEYEILALAPMLAEVVRGRTELLLQDVRPQYIVVGSWWWDVLTDYGAHDAGGMAYGLPILRDPAGPLRKVHVVGAGKTY